MSLPIDETLVRRLIAEQFPAWIDLPIRRVASDGWDNRTFRLGSGMTVRLPSHGRYSAQVGKEQTWLPRLAKHLPLPIPEPLAVGAASALFPRPWSIYRWIDGDIATHARIADQVRFAEDLGGFLVALAGIDASDGPPPGPHNFHRGGPLERYDADTRTAVATLGDTIDGPAAMDVWHTALDAADTHPPVWFHGDVSDGNLLVSDERLSAVIDFGGCGVGDPACDLVIAWTFLTGESRPAFAQVRRVDDATWARARGWAIWKALIVAAGMTGTNSPGLGRSFRVINDVMADHAHPFA